MISSLTNGFRSLRNRNYRLFWFGQMVSLVGTWMQDVALSWLVLSLTDSPMSLGFTMTFRFLPVMLLSLYGGVLADRLPKRKTLIATQGVQLIVALILAILTSTGAITVTIIYALVFLRGMVDSIDGPTRQAFIPEMVGKDNLSNAIALNSTLFNSARIVGPAVGAAIISTLGTAACFYINAVSFSGVIIGLLSMRPRDLHPPVWTSESESKSKLIDGFRYVRATPDVLMIIIIMSALGTFGFNSQIILPLVAKYVLSAGVSSLALLTTSMGVGSVVAGLIVAYWGKPTRRLLFTAAAVFIALFFTLAFSSSRIMGAGLTFCIGICMVMTMTTANTRLQLLVPGHLRGRVMGMYILFFMGTTPIGSVVIGQLAERFGVKAMIVSMAGLCLTGVLVAAIYARKALSYHQHSAAPDSHS